MDGTLVMRHTDGREIELYPEVFSGGEYFWHWERATEHPGPGYDIRWCNISGLAYTVGVNSGCSWVDAKKRVAKQIIMPLWCKLDGWSVVAGG